MATSKRYYSVAITMDEEAHPTVSELVETLTALTNWKITEAALPNNKSTYRVDVEEELGE
jgi:hypothetical protein